MRTAKALVALVVAAAVADPLCLAVSVKGASKRIDQLCFYDGDNVDPQTSSPLSSSSCSQGYLPSTSPSETSLPSLSSIGDATRPSLRSTSQSNPTKAIDARSQSSTSRIRQSGNLHPQQKYDTLHFRKQLEGVGLTKDSSVSDIDEKTSEIMSRYDPNPRAAAALYQYLKEIQVDEHVYALFTGIRTRRRHVITARQRRKNERYTRLTSDPEAIGRKERNPALSAKYRKLEKEKRARRQSAQLQEFATKVSRADLNYRMDPSTYARSELPLRDSMNHNVYGYYQGKLQQACSVPESWRQKYRRARKSLDNGNRDRSRTALEKKKHQQQAANDKQEIGAGSSLSDAMQPSSARLESVVDPQKSPYVSLPDWIGRRKRKRVERNPSKTLVDIPESSPSNPSYLPKSPQYEALPLPQPVVAMLAANPSRRSTSIIIERDSSNSEENVSDSDDGKDADYKPPRQQRKRQRQRRGTLKVPPNRPTVAQKTYRGGQRAVFGMIKVARPRSPEHTFE